MAVQISIRNNIEKAFGVFFPLARCVYGSFNVVAHIAIDRVMIFERRWEALKGNLEAEGEPMLSDCYGHPVGKRPC